jgi:hypothetical protein
MWIGDHIERFLALFYPNPSNDPKLCTMCTDGIDNVRDGMPLHANLLPA